MTGVATHGGVVFRVGERVAFLPASVAVAVLPMGELARLPGAPAEMLGVTVHRGEAIPVLGLGPARTSMLVCSYLGEHFGLVGVDILGTGRFPAAETPSVHGERVIWDGEAVQTFDVAQLFARAFGERRT